MHINSNYSVYMIDGQQTLIPISDSGFHGIVRNNKTAADIVDLLKEDVSRESIIDFMLMKYEATKEQIEKDVDIVLDTLRQIGALAE